MGETQRTLAALRVLLADNTTEEISPQDLRDLMETLRNGHGGMYVSTDAATSPENTDDYLDVAGTFTLIGDVYNWDMNTNGQLRYTGPTQRSVIVVTTMSMLSGGSSQVVHFRLAKNGTSVAHSEIQRKIAAGTDIGAAACHADFTVVTNDYITLQLRNATSTATVTVEHAFIGVVDSAV